ncbi:MAG: sensor histidine kinase [Acutalibacteraceae bacterium]|jgi:two-component system sensor histidine kinase CiaH
MLKRYRRRFVVSTMALIGAVLLAVFGTLGVYIVRNDEAALRSTLRHMLEPWDTPGDSFRPLRDVGQPPGDMEDERPGRFDGERDDMRDAMEDEQLVTVFYDRSTDEVSISRWDEDSDADSSSERIADAARAIAAREEPYGRAEGYLYYKEASGDQFKIALAANEYLVSRHLRTGLWVGSLFIGAMGLFFLISLWLARLAARPMEQAIEMERQFVADISHDLKTPITVVLANNSILRASPDATVAEQTQWIDSTESAARDMMNMVQEMLTLSQLDSVGRAVEKRPVSLSMAVQKAALQMESVAYDRGITLEESIADGVTVAATPEYAERICNSLIENALKYEPDGGRVEVSLTLVRKKAVLSVRNAGSVIAPEDLPHVFERFYRSDKARTSRSGHGLGLPILKQITDLLGAAIEVKSDPDTGTVFTVTFEETSENE